MMRLLRNPFFKSFRKGRLQYRDFSSGSEKVATTGTKIVGYCYKAAFCGGGVVLGGLTTPRVAKQVQEAEERTTLRLKKLDKDEAEFEVIKKEWISANQD